MNRPAPISLQPMLKPRVWGGDRLVRVYGKDPGDLDPQDAIGESWEIADLPLTIDGGRSVIVRGPGRGETLRNLVSRDPGFVLGRRAASDDGGFPLLIKFLDARSNLSVQVHPTAEYTAHHPGTHLKTEAWVILDAEPGALIYRGIKPGVTADEFRRRVKDDTVADAMIAVPARPGDCHVLPSGTCHALGAGILVAEVQTPSDTTFRVWDWGRTGRELHLDQAIECIDFSDPGEADPPVRSGPPIEAAGCRTIPLGETEFFDIESVTAVNRSMLTIPANGGPTVLIAVSGTPRVRAESADAPEHMTGTASADEPDTIAMPAGTTILLPAALSYSTLLLEPDDCVLRVTIPEARTLARD